MVISVDKAGKKIAYKRMSAKVVELKLPEDQFKAILQVAKDKVTKYIMNILAKENERLEKKLLRKEWEENAPVYSIEDLNRKAEEAKRLTYVSMKEIKEKNLDIDELTRQGKGVRCDSLEEAHEYMASVKSMR